MNKEQLIKGSWKIRVKIRPPASRFDGGPQGAEHPITVADGKFGLVTKDELPLTHMGSPRTVTLKQDHILEFTSDPVHGKWFGSLTLKVQIKIGGDHLWIEPIIPKQFGGR